MRPFGAPGSSFRYGYTLPVLLSHLEGLKDDEAETMNESGKGPKWKRLKLVEDAIALLNEAYDMGEED